MLKRILKGLSALELVVSLTIIVIFFALVTTTMIYFYQFPPFDMFKDASVYRNVFFELTKTLKEADSVKNIYTTATINAIYVQVQNTIYAYRLNKSIPLQNRKLEKSVDGGYNWFYLPNTSNIEDIIFKASTPYSSAKVVLVSFKSNYNPRSKLSSYHQFVVKLRKEQAVNFVISGINPSNQVIFTIGNNNSWQTFSPVSNRTSLNTLNLDTFINSFNIVSPVQGSTTSTYQLWKFAKASYTAAFSYDYLDTISSFDRVVFTSPGSDNDWIKVISVGNYLYTAYAVLETLYTSSSGLWEQYYSVYFAYRKLVAIPGSYTGNYTKSSWIKRKVFSIRRASIGNGDVRFVRLAYGQAIGNNFHITFCVGTTGFNTGLNDFYYAGSPDGINWIVKNIDDSFSTDTLNPLFVVPLVGFFQGTTNTLHFVFVNRIGNNAYNISYFSTNDLVSFSTIQNINTNSTYRTTPDRPIVIRSIYDFDALLYNNAIHLVFSCDGRSLTWGNSVRSKLIYMVKQNFSNPAVYNIYPTGSNTSIVFFSDSLAIGGNYVHIVASNGANLYYIRQEEANSLTQDFLVNSYNQTYTIRCIDTFFSGSYLHISFYLNGGTVGTDDLGYVRISNPVSPVLQRIGNVTIDDNLAISTNSIDGQILLASDNVTNGVMSGITLGADGYLHFLTFCQTSNSLGEVIYTDPNNANNPMTSTNRFDTLLIHRNIPYYRSISASDDGSVVVYSDNNSTDTATPTGGRTNDLKSYINGFITEIDGNRRFDISNSTDIPGSRSCGFYNDVKTVNGSIYVAYSELVGTSLRLRLARSTDNGQSWQIETVNPSNVGRDINLNIKSDLINVTCRNSLNNLIINKKQGGIWVAFSPATTTNNFNIRTFLDTQNRLHILSFSSNDTSLLVIKDAYYRVFDNNTNTFFNTGLVGDSLLSAYLTTFSSLGPYGDIFVDNDGTVYIIVNSVRIGQTNYGLDLLIYKNNQWQSPIRIPPQSPVNYLITSLRINKW